MNDSEKKCETCHNQEYTSCMACGRNAEGAKVSAPVPQKEDWEDAICSKGFWNLLQKSEEKELLDFIRHTRLSAYEEGYRQGKFDMEADREFGIYRKKVQLEAIDRILEMPSIFEELTGTKGKSVEDIERVRKDIISDSKQI